jgi:hypothetical protein
VHGIDDWCVTYVADLKHEGLFRKAGHVDRQRLLCDRLNADGEKPHLEDFTVHDCANVLKIFLGELPEPLLTEKYLTAYRQVAGILLASVCYVYFL